MKKCILLLMVLVIVLSCSAFLVSAEDSVLTLAVKLQPIGIGAQVTYIAQLAVTPVNPVPVIGFYCGSNVPLAKVPVNNQGIATYTFNQTPGRYSAVAIWENGPTPLIKSNIVDYIVQ